MCQFACIVTDPDLCCKLVNDLLKTTLPVLFKKGMNYVVASLLLGRIPEQYTDIDHITPEVTVADTEGDEGTCMLFLRSFWL